MIEIDKNIGRPDALCQLLTSYDFARALKKHRQDLNRLLGQMNLGAVLRELPRPEVEFKQGEANRVFRGGNRHSTPLPDSVAILTFTCFACMDGLKSAKRGDNFFQPIAAKRIAGGETIRLAGIAPLAASAGDSDLLWRPAREKGRNYESSLEVRFVVFVRRCSYKRRPGSSNAGATAV